MTEAPLSKLLREETRNVHTRAERCAFIRRLMGGQSSLRAYGHYLRGLLPVYETLEGCLQHHRGDPHVAAIDFPELYRAAALRADLADLGETPDAMPRPAPATYACRIREAGTTDPALLIAHSYVRYFGDLSGGQMIGQLMAKHYGLHPDHGARFYAFTGIDNAQAFKERYRAHIDALSLAEGRRRALVEEAIAAFEHNIKLFEEVEALTTVSENS